MKPVAIIGAGGYVGARLIEQATLLQHLPLIPIVRSARSQGRIARYGIQTFRGDAGDPESLIPLLKGCGAAVNLTMGENGRMVTNIKAVHEACRIAEVPILVHMSSAEVFGRVSQQGLSDDSAPSERHWMEYARTKSAAETWLRSQFKGPVRIVILRPGLIWGPGSGWLIQPAQDLVDGTAYLFNEGHGICNLIHVDNLIEHLKQLTRAQDVESGIFNISDNEILSWADYYGAIAKEVGVAESTIRMLPQSAFSETYLQRIAKFGELAPAKAVKSRLASETKVRIKQQLADRLHPPIREAEPFKQPVPSITKGMWWIQGAERKLPSAAFLHRYPDTHLKQFQDLMSAAGRWLRFAGFAMSEVPQGPKL